MENTLSQSAFKEADSWVMRVVGPASAGFEQMTVPIPLLPKPSPYAGDFYRVLEVVWLFAYLFSLISVLRGAVFSALYSLYLVVLKVAASFFFVRTGGFRISRAWAHDGHCPQLVSRGHSRVGKGWSRALAF